MNVSLRNYGNYSSDNYGAHCIRVGIGSLTLWFSYQTVVAFGDGHGIRVRENVWGGTTGKHLNWIDGGDKGSRMSGEMFEKELEKCLKKHDLQI